mgnify:CR=1 FL=1
MFSSYDKLKIKGFTKIDFKSEFVSSDFYEIDSEVDPENLQMDVSKAKDPGGAIVRTGIMVSKSGLNPLYTEILNNQILEKYPENIYASRYQQLIQKKLLSDSIESKKWAIPKVKWKTLKCPHCTSKIPFSWLSQENRRRIDNKDLDNLEIKCPTIETFNKLVLTEEINPKYFAQMQMQMLATNAEKTHFYNYVIHNGKEIDYTIEVPRCEETISLLKERIEYATELKNEYYNTLVKRLG